MALNTHVREGHDGHADPLCNYVLGPSEHPAAGERGPIPDPFETVYLTHRPRYRFALVVPRVVPSAVRRGLALFRLWLTGQAPQDGVVLALPELTPLHEDRGRLLECVRRLRSARPPRRPPPGEGEGHP